MSTNAKYRKHFGQIVPYPKEEHDSFKSDAADLVKARKFEKKQFKRCALKCTDPAKFKKLAKTYLSSRRCLIAALWESNGLQPIKKRLSIRRIIDVSKKYKILKNLKEDVVVRTIQKKSGSGTREIQDFGPVARAAQRMVVKLLRLTYAQKEFQYPGTSAPQKIEMALTLLAEKGYEYVAEIDIRNHYPSFEMKKLKEHLPLPKEAVKQIVVAENANRVCLSGHPIHQHYYNKACSGIPQGSAASSEVASESVAHLKMVTVKDVVLINYADNFFLFAKNPKNLDFALIALSYGVSKLPGGSFDGKIVNHGTATESFRMLGCWITRNEAQVEVVPTETSLNYLRARFKLQYQKTNATLKSAMLDNDPALRLEGVQEFLSLKNFVIGWTSAYSFCGEMVETIRIDRMYYVERLHHGFGISDDELKKVKDRSVVCSFDLYGY